MTESAQVVSSVFEYLMYGNVDVKLYIEMFSFYLFGALQDNGICGCPWETWGFSSAWDWSESDESDSDNGDLVPNSFIIDTKTSVMTLSTDETRGSVASSGRTRTEKPQYEEDGWERVELGSLSNLQLCRTDERWSTNRHSHTVSFRKK